MDEARAHSCYRDDRELVRGDVYPQQPGVKKKSGERPGGGGGQRFILGPKHTALLHLLKTHTCTHTDDPHQPEIYINRNPSSDEK